VQNPTHLGLEELKRKAREDKESKAYLKAVEEANKDNPSTMRDDDVLVVIHQEELQLVIALLYETLESNRSKEDKRTALNLLKLLEG
jgi:hypothetical protein